MKKREWKRLAKATRERIVNAEHELATHKTQVDALLGEVARAQDIAAQRTRDTRHAEADRDLACQETERLRQETERLRLERAEARRALHTLRADVRALAAGEPTPSQAGRILAVLEP